MLKTSSRKLDCFRKSSDSKSVFPEQILSQYFQGALIKKPKASNKKKKSLQLPRKSSSLNLVYKNYIYYFPQLLQHENKASPN